MTGRAESGTEPDPLHEIEQLARSLEQRYADAWNEEDGPGVARVGNTSSAADGFRAIAEVANIEAIAAQVWHQQRHAVAVIDANLWVVMATGAAEQALADYRIVAREAKGTLIADRTLVPLILAKLVSVPGAPSQCILERDGRPALVVRIEKIQVDAGTLHLDGLVDYVVLRLERLSGVPPRTVDRSLPTDLTEKEQRILAALLHGQSVAQIAKAMKRSPNTIKTHRRKLYAKLGVRSQRELIARYSAQTGPLG